MVLRGLLQRATEDVDLVDEVPVAIRSEHTLLQELATRHGLRVTHFQGHYPPEGWAARTTDAGTFGKIRLRLVDPADIIAGKVYSPRAKDLDDFRMLCEGLDRGVLRDRVIRGLPSRWSDPEARARAIQNWYIAYGEALADG
ncbi:DUF6036 family nucleotidyltransferase [Aquisphaera insulae]|uniref:DUF6036 family nucleotidyltransferase n=1 Tax=Aquisphaera insulae TaxID=2712864 RepID=UPI0013EC2FAE|nr:DUF6036 family nucleotidyltransferase [Aquisphaera insulae]